LFGLLPIELEPPHVGCYDQSKSDYNSKITESRALPAQKLPPFPP